MKIRRSSQSPVGTNVPLDEVDMFLLNLLEHEIELGALADITSRNALECLRRVLRLGRLGLVRLHFDTQDERLLAQVCDEAADEEMLDHANTLRPPPQRGVKLEERVTTRPSAPTRSFVGGIDRAPKTGVRRGLTPARSNEPVRVGKMSR